jgi:hypothetical protein
LLVFFWLLLLVMAHIMRHALSSTLAVGLGVSLLYMLVSMQLLPCFFHSSYM